MAFLEVVKSSFLRVLILLGFIDNFEYRLNLELIEWDRNFFGDADERRLFRLRKEDYYLCLSAEICVLFN